MSTLQERIRQVRGKISQVEFAKSIGIPVNTLGRYERGINDPDINFILALHAKFGVSLDWVLLGKGTIHPEPESQPYINKNSHCIQCKELLARLHVLTDRLYEGQERERAYLGRQAELERELLVLRGALYEARESADASLNHQWKLEQELSDLHIEEKLRAQKEQSQKKAGDLLHDEEEGH